MLFRIALLLAVSLPLSGCGGLIIYDGSRKVSQDAIGRIMVETAPGVPPQAAADCVIKGMTVTELVQMGTSDTNPITAAHRAKVTEVKTRAGVAECIAALPKAEAAK